MSNYQKQTWNNGVAGGTPIDAARLRHIEAGIEFNSKRKLYAPRNSLFGPATSDAPTITTGVAADGAFNESYSITGGVLPAIWPVDAWGDMAVVGQSWAGRTSQASVSSVVTHRFMYDGTDIALYMLGGLEFDLYVDGQPYASNPITTVVSAGFSPYGLQKLVFATAKPRLIEIRSLSGLSTIFGKKPYRMWKPAPDPNPKIAVVGDSYVYPATLSNTIAASYTPDPFLKGLYQRMPALLGITALTTDGISGTGYIAPAAANRPYSHVERLEWLDRIQPDVIVMHGGGVNDLYNGSSVAAIITAVRDHFNNLREQHPDAKLVFMEGIAPPIFTPQATYNANFKLIREGAQAALNDDGNEVYYIDLATTRPPIAGTGYVTATNASGNSDIYVGYDQAHYTERGALYLRNVIATKLRQVLSDNGELAGSLIL